EVLLASNDVRRHHEHEISLLERVRALPEERAEHGDVAQHRDLLLGARRDVADEAADDDGLLIGDDELRLRRALADRNRAQRSAERRALLAALLGDVETD